MEQGAPKARLLVVDDHPFMRVAINAILTRDPSLEVVGEARDGQEAIERCRELCPDLILMDVSMPRMNGLEATRKLKAQSPETSVLILTAHADQSLLMDAVKAGAAGYVLKGENPYHVLDAVRAVLDGKTPLDQGLAMKLLRNIGEEAAVQEDVRPQTQSTTSVEPSSSASSMLNPLTPRETEILGHIASGKANGQIANELHLSRSTVKRHLEHILPKLGVSDRTQAAVKAVEYIPSELQSAYNIPAGGAGKTIAIVDAFDNPNALQDLKVYRQEFGLAAGPSIKKMNQSGQVVETLDTTTGNISTGSGKAPSANTGWGQEIALDLDMASAICPSCNILLVEANSNSFNDLGAAVDTAAAQSGVKSISNSYGAKEFFFEETYESHYNHQHIAITVSSGDSGYGVQFPAASRYVIAVGGTSLTRSTTGAWSESVWSGAGSGCSAYIAEPSWQTDKGCANRTVADVSAVANPNTGVAVYDSYGSTVDANGDSLNWYVFGGTSVSAPIIASVYALADNTIDYSVYPYLSKYTYDHTSPSTLNDVVSGSNGGCTKRKAYLCTGVTGYDGPSGLGTPKGVGAF
jgi:DNA-binding NarL/FixJ family response regulator